MSHNNNKQQQNKETQNDWQIRTVIGVVSECVIEQAQKYANGTSLVRMRKECETH